MVLSSAHANSRCRVASWDGTIYVEEFCAKDNSRVVSGLLKISAHLDLHRIPIFIMPPSNIIVPKSDRKDGHWVELSHLGKDEIPFLIA